MSATISQVQGLLRPSERCTCVSEMWIVRADLEKKRRVVAVVASESGAASVFLLRRNGAEASLVVAASLPIAADFRMSLSQSNSDTKSTAFTLRLSSLGSELVLFASHLPDIQHLLNECRAWQADALSQSPLDYTWLDNYKDRHDRTERVTNHESNNPFILNDFSINPLPSKQIKENWLAARQREREADLVTFDPFYVFTGTWNVNGNDPTEPLGKWLDVSDGEILGNDTGADLYVLGFQELDLSTEIYLISDNTKQTHWCEVIEQYLNGMSSKYYRVAIKQLIGLLIVVYAKEDLKPEISEVTVESVGTGLMGFGNKGGVACRLRLRDSYLAFVNAHLAADTNQVERRNQDYQEICRRTKFPVSSGGFADVRDFSRKNPWTSTVDLNTLAGSPTSPSGQTHVSIFDSDHLFFMGDLNYRVPLPDTTAKSLLAENQVAHLFANDQLTAERAAGRVLAQFEEHPVVFRPTYKFDVGTSEYDTSEKKRSPSWCDRILWFVNRHARENAEWLRCFWYRAAMEMTMSDHKPVGALFSVLIRRIQGSQMESITSDLIRELDRLENDAVPRLEVEETALSFGDVKFSTSSTRPVSIRNTGKVVARFRFVPKPNDQVPAKPFYYITPNTGELLPGDIMRINITILVRQPQTAASLTLGTQTLTDTLLIHTDQSGKDTFITTEAAWLPSCMGASLELLCSLQRPVRVCGLEGVRMVESHLKQGKGREIVDAPLGSVEVGDVAALQGAKENPSVPKELWRLVDFVYRYGMDVDNLFKTATDPLLVQYIVECLDTGAEFDFEGLILEKTDEPEAASNEDSASQDDLRVFKSTTEMNESGASVNLDIDLLLKSAAPRPDTATPPAVLKLGRRKGRAASVHAMAECIIKFFDGLQVSVVPEALYLWCVQEGYLDYKTGEQILGSMPPVHANVFVYIVSFLKEVLVAYGGRPSYTAESLARVFAPVLIRKPKDMDTDRLLKDVGGFGAEVRAAMFVMQFLRKV
ncbi:Endonuclease/exonuclease/phosphatase [Chytriomyces sp. MP71]|nr:Endonuclease/exonuclease/phosphatase [Chytriomyces sp. MP71]